MTVTEYKLLFLNQDVITKSVLQPCIKQMLDVMMSYD